MKYGIQIKHSDGTFSWAAAAKGGRISQTREIDDTALFVQKDSAIKALKAARKYGYEKQGMTFQVVGIDYSVVETTDVEKPAIKAGHMLVGINKDGDQVYFASGKGTLTYATPEWENIERATIFKSDTEAALKLQDCREWYADKLSRMEAEYEVKRVKNAQQKAAGPNTGYWDRVTDYQVQYAKDAVEKAKVDCDWVETVKAVFNQ